MTANTFTGTAILRSSAVKAVKMMRPEQKSVSAKADRGVIARRRANR